MKVTELLKRLSDRDQRTYRLVLDGDFKGHISFNNHTGNDHNVYVSWDLEHEMITTLDELWNEVRESNKWEI